MSSKSELVLAEQSLKVARMLPRQDFYLPNEGLQGETIPSYILWENMKVDSVRVTFHSPLKFKEVFNAGSWEINDDNIVVKNVELDGYIGLSFESVRVTELEVIVPVEYTIYASNGELVKETRKIKLFRPELEIKTKAEKMIVDPSTGFIRGRIGVKNIGRGVLILHVSTTKGSSVKIQTPPEHRDFAEKFRADLIMELKNLAKDFPQFRSALKEMLAWDKKEFQELSAEERNKFAEFLNKMARALASDKNLLRGFIEAYSKALAKNSELIEMVRRVINVYESLVSKDILLINPLDEVVLTGKKGEIALTISQTDKVFGTYDDIRLPKFEITSSSEIKLPIHKLFVWG
jgi:hypothetical protein